MVWGFKGKNTLFSKSAHSKVGVTVFFGDVQDKGSFEIRKLFSRIFKKSFPRKYTYKVSNESFYFLPDFKSLIIAKAACKERFSKIIFHDLNFESYKFLTAGKQFYI